MAATTTTDKIAIAGDFRAGFTIADRLGMQAELIPTLFGTPNNRPTGQRGIFVVWRTGSKVVVPNALRYIEVK
jgi:HK97 family phage major capsid protein